MSSSISLDRVFSRDTQSYFSILLDDNNRKPVARLYFNDVNKKIFSVFGVDKKEEKIVIAKIDDIYAYREKIIASCLTYLGSSTV